jgi:hypothetical protein
VEETLSSESQSGSDQVLQFTKSSEINSEFNVQNPASPSSQTFEDRLALAAKDPYPWVMSPKIDLLFCCGGIFWLLYAVVALSGYKVDLYGNPMAFTLATISILGTHFFGDGHQIATMYRVYQSKQTRKILGLKVAIVGVIALMAGLSTLFIGSTTSFFLKLVLAWGIQHQLAQSYGIALVYCYKRKYYLNTLEKDLMNFMVHATMVFLILRMFTYKTFGSYKINGYEIPFWPAVPEWFCTASLIVMQASIFAFVVMVVRKYLKEKQLFPLPGLMTLMTLITLPFVAGDQFVLIWVMFSTTFFHTTQYVVVTAAYYFKERGLPPSVPFNQINRMLLTPVGLKYFAILFGIGFFAAYIFPMWMADHGVSKAIAFASVYVFVNVHHFITDMYIWKLRDPYVQKLLIA